MARSHRLSAALMAVAAVGAVGCSRAIGGTPVATPGQAGVGDLLNTTCAEYVEMSESDRRDVIVAIGDADNQLVALSPDLWVGLAAALCGFAGPDAAVKDVVKGSMR